MDHILHRGLTAALAATVAGAGLIAVTPAVSPPALHPQQVDVQLTDAIADMFSALGNSIQELANWPGQALDHLLGLNLPLSIAASADAAFALAAIPANLLLGGVGEVNEWLGGAAPNFVSFGLSSGFLPSTDVLGTLVSYLGAVANSVGTAVSDLFSLNLLGSLEGSISALIFGVVAIPSNLVMDTTDLIWHGLLGLPGV